MTELLSIDALGELPRWPPATSAPARFFRLLADVIPGWRFLPPEADAVDLHVAALDPYGLGYSVAITTAWPTVAGYRDNDEWQVTGCAGHAAIVVEMQLRHDADQDEFDAVLRVLRATWAAD